jgi:hypothetical protein
MAAPDASRGGLQLLVNGIRAGQLQVAADIGIEQVRVLRADLDGEPVRPCSVNVIPTRR